MPSDDNCEHGFGILGGDCIYCGLSKREIGLLARIAELETQLAKTDQFWRDSEAECRAVQGRLDKAEALIEDIQAWEVKQRVDHSRHTGPFCTGAVSWVSYESREVARILNQSAFRRDSAKETN